jgi:cyanophycinase
LDSSAALSINPPDMMLKPVYLFADSQLLFWKEHNRYFIGSIRALLPSEAVKAAYVGASNGDLPEFYAMFREAMACAGIDDCRMIKSDFDADDSAYLDQADLILLAGGEVALGWDAFCAHGIDQRIVQRYAAGALIIGVSAGAVQLGRYGCKELGPGRRELFKTFGIVPYLIDAHDEKDDWQRLKHTLHLLGQGGTGIGIPSGGGMIFHSDLTLEPVRRPLDQFHPGPDGAVQAHILLPAGS